MPEYQISCKTCPTKFKEPCIKEYGEYTGHGDDHTAIEGTHFCRYSWTNRPNSEAHAPMNATCEKCGRRYCDHENKY